MKLWNFVSLFRRNTRPSSPRRRVRLSLEAFEERVVPARIDWTAGADGNFNDAASWTVEGTGAHRVPGPSDDAAIGAGTFTIDMTESHHVNSLNASVVRFDLSGSGTTLTLDNLIASSAIEHLVLLSGTSLAVTNGSTTISQNSLIAGNIAVAAGATLSFANGGTQMVTNGAALTGAGQYQVTSATLSIADGVTADAPSHFSLAGGAVVGPGTFNIPAGITTTWTSGSLAGPTTVAAGGILHATTANEKDLNGAALTNNGTVNWDTGVINAGNEAVVTNNGTWNVQGDLRLIHTYQNTPTFNNEATGVYRKTAGSGSSTIEGQTFNNQGGTVEVQTGNLFLPGGSSTDGTWNAVNPGSVLDLTSGGTRTIGGTLTGSGAGTVQFSSGTLTVLATGATFNFTGPLFQWTGGTINVEALGATLTSTSILTLAQANEKVLDGVTLNTPSTVNWTAGRLNIGDEAVIDNSGTWNVQGDLTLTHTFGNTPTFDNAATGVYRKTTGNADAIVQGLVFNNQGGTVEVQTGNLFLPGGTSTDGTYNAVSPGSLLDLTSGGTRDIGGTLTGSGAGTVRFSTGDLDVLATGATISFPGSLFQWTGGTISGGGPGATLTNSDTLTLSTATDKVLDAVTLVNAGTVTMSTGRLNGGDEAMIVNNGTWSIEGDVSLIHTFGNAPTFSNTGTFNKDLGASTNATQIDFIFDNGDTGVVNVNSGNLLLSRGGTDTGTFNAVAGTTLQFAGGTHTLNAGATLPSDGLTQITFGATVIVTSVVSVANFGVLNGTLDITSTGILNVSGTFDLAVNGVLIVEIGGDTASGTDSGQVNVAGTAGLAGTLVVDLVNDYVPVVGDSYAVLTFGAINGSFHSVFLPGLAPGRAWDQSYAGGAFTLTVIPS
jgi:hypothetical protein